ncbi:MAG TPA: precorrin-2 C(20)-methyltransferase [Acidimicrobiales bacterium]|nr:precorrin-2 C(20)-methyltransferase [Acidimicrobiales bacterium]
MAAQPGSLVGVGVGPGDPDLLTLRALNTLRAADRVVAPSVAADAVGRAEAIVRQAAPELAIERLVFDMGPERATSHRAAAEQLLPALDAGEHVAFVTLGDPNIYSTFSALTGALRILRPGMDIGTVPGIMAFQELAARAGVALLDGTESLRLVTALDGPAHLEEAIVDRDAAVVVYKGGRHLPAIRLALEHAGRLEGAVFGELLGLPGERLGSMADQDHDATYLATVIVPPSRRSHPE